MTQKELLDAFKQDRREQVDIRIGQIPLSPTIGRMGNYNVVQRGVSKTNSATQLASLLAQAPQIAAQFKNIQEKAGTEAANALTEDEIIKRVEEGDFEANGFLKDWGKQRAFSRQIYNQYFDLEMKPKLDALDAKFADLSPRELDQMLSVDGKVSAMTDDDLQDYLESAYRDAVDVENQGLKLDDHQKVLHNAFLKRIPILSSKTLSAVRAKQKQFIDDSIKRNTSDEFSQSIDLIPFDIDADKLNTVHLIQQVVDEQYKEFDFDPAKETQVVNPDLEKASTASGIPKTERPTNAPVIETKLSSIKGDISVYSPTKGGDKMEGGYPSSVAGPDGKFLVRTVSDYVKGNSDYITIAGNPEYYGRSYIIPSMPYEDPATGKRKELINVRAVVHDTGGAFKTVPEGRFDIPLGKDLNNKQMASYHGLLNEFGVEFVREINKDGDPIEFTLGEPGEIGPKGKRGKQKRRSKRKPLTVEQHRELNSNKYQKYIKDNSAILAERLRSRITTAQQEGGSLSDRQIEDATIRSFANVIDYMISSGDDQMAIADKFLQDAQNGDISIGQGDAKKPLNKTPAGQRLISLMNASLFTKEQQLAKEEETERTGTKTAERLQKEIAGLSLMAEEVSRPELKDKIAETRSQLMELRSKGSIDEKYMRDLLTSLEIQEKLINENVRKSHTYMEPNFEGNVSNRYKITNVLDSYANSEQFVNSVQELGKDFDIFTKIQQDDFGKETKKLDEILANAPETAASDARDALFDFLHDKYNQLGITSFEKIPDVSREEILTKYKEFYDASVKAIIESRGDALKKRAESAMGVQQTEDVEEQEIPSGFTPEEWENQKDKAYSQTEAGLKDLLSVSGKLRKENIFEYRKTYLDALAFTFTNEEAREMMKKNNSPSAISTALEDGSRKYYERFDITELDSPNPSEKTKNAKAWEQSAKVFGIPMSVHKNGGVMTGSKRFFVPYSKDIIANYSLSVNSNNRLGTEEYAKTGVYNIQATKKAAKGDTADLKLIYDTYFKGPSIKKKVPFKTFLQYRLDLGRLQGWIETPKDK